MLGMLKEGSVSFLLRPEPVHSLFSYSTSGVSSGFVFRLVTCMFFSVISIEFRSSLTFNKNMKWNFKGFKGESIGSLLQIKIVLLYAYLRTTVNPLD